MGARWEAFGKRLALVLGRDTQELEPTSGWSGTVGKGWGLQPEMEQGRRPLRTLVVVRQHRDHYVMQTGAA